MAVVGNPWFNIPALNFFITAFCINCSSREEEQFQSEFSGYK